MTDKADNDEIQEFDPDSTINVSVRIPKSMWRRVRFLAIEREASGSALWLEAMSEYLERHSEVQS